VYEKYKNHPMMAGFTEWAKANGIGDPQTEHAADWFIWFHCYVAGAVTALRAKMIGGLAHHYSQLELTDEANAGE
jgi:hypothetical protein